MNICLRTLFSLSLLLIMALAGTAELQAQEVQIWHIDQNGDTLQITSNTTLPAGSQIFLLAKNTGVPAGNDPRRHWVYAWNRGDCGAPALSTRRWLPVVLGNGTYSPSVKPMAIYSDDDLGVLQFPHTITIGNGIPSPNPGTGNPWINMEILQPIRPGRLFNIEVRYTSELDQTVATFFDLELSFPSQSLEFVTEAMPVNHSGIRCDWESVTEDSINPATNRIRITLDTAFNGEDRRFFLTFLAASDLITGENISLNLQMVTNGGMSHRELGFKNEADLPSLNRTDPVLDSDDPNAKVADPNEICEPRRITYVIHFENEGVAPANRIWIIDSLHPYLEEDSLFNHGSSPYAHLNANQAPPFQFDADRLHFIDMPANWAIPDVPADGMDIYIDESRRKVAWVLTGIDLPGVDEFGVGTDNKGWVSYAIEMEDGLTLSEAEQFGTHAVIGFDNNDPIFTGDDETFAALAYTTVDCPDEDVPAKSIPWWIWILLLLLLILLALIRRAKS